MPAWAARYFILITNVKAQRLQEITEEDAIREVFFASQECADISVTGRKWYTGLWDSINPKYPWGMNPYIFAYTFKLVQSIF
jgi:hypothetical protein